jgi:hypothetical protein
VPLVMLYRTMIILELYRACASTKYAFLAHCAKLMLQPLLLQTACASLITDSFLSHCFKLMIQHLLPQTACFTVNCCFFNTLFELMLQPLLLQMACFTVKWRVYFINLIPDFSYNILPECAVAGMQMPRWWGGACCAAACRCRTSCALLHADADAGWPSPPCDVWRTAPGRARRGIDPCMYVLYELCARDAAHGISEYGSRSLALVTYVRLAYVRTALIHPTPPGSLASWRSSLFFSSLTNTN